MELFQSEMKLNKYLDKIKEEQNLPEDMSYQQVLKHIKGEVQFRENLIKTMREKLSKLQELVNNKFSYDLSLSNVHQFHLELPLQTPISLIEFKDIVELKLHYIFDVKFEVYFTGFTMVLNLHESKIKQIKKYM